MTRLFLALLMGVCLLVFTAVPIAGKGVQLPKHPKLLNPKEDLVIAWGFLPGETGVWTERVFPNDNGNHAALCIEDLTVQRIFPFAGLAKRIMFCLGNITVVGTHEFAATAFLSGRLKGGESKHLIELHNCTILRSTLPTGGGAGATTLPDAPHRYVVTCSGAGMTFLLGRFLTTALSSGELVSEPDLMGFAQFVSVRNSTILSRLESARFQGWGRRTHPTWFHPKLINFKEREYLEVLYLGVSPGETRVWTERVIPNDNGNHTALCVEDLIVQRIFPFPRPAIGEGMFCFGDITVVGIHEFAATAFVPDFQIGRKPKRLTEIPNCTILVASGSTFLNGAPHTHVVTCSDESGNSLLGRFLTTDLSAGAEVDEPGPMMPPTPKPMPTVG